MVLLWTMQAKSQKEVTWAVMVSNTLKTGYMGWYLCRTYYVHFIKIRLCSWDATLPCTSTLRKFLACILIWRLWNPNQLVIHPRYYQSANKFVLRIWANAGGVKVEVQRYEWFIPMLVRWQCQTRWCRVHPMPESWMWDCMGKYLLLPILSEYW